MSAALAGTDPGDYGKPAHASPFHRLNGPFGALREHGHGAQEGGTECPDTDAPRHSIGARNGTLSHLGIENGAFDGGQIGCRFRPDAPCDGNGVMPCRPRLLNEFAANTATGTKDGYAHGASVSDEYRHWTNRDSLSKVPGHRIAAAVPAPAPLSPAHEGGTGVQVVPVVLRGRMRVQG